VQEQTSSNSLGENVPKLRFPGFEEEWESVPMGKIGTFTKGAPLTKADITETGTPLILYGELYTSYGDIATTIIRKTDKDVKSECYSILGDVIIPTSGESPEEISTCTCVMQDGVILAGDLNIYRTNDVDGRFLSYEINHVRNREIAKIAQGKSIVHIRSDELSKIVIRFPSKAEQTKIIKIFSYLDKKIELQKELIKSLKLYKRGLLAKLFPQKEESVPRYRFDGFTNDWEQRKLGDYCEQIKETVDPQKTPDCEFSEYSMPAFDNGNDPDVVYGNEMNSIRKVINTSCLLINKLNVRKKRIWLVEKPKNNAVCSAEFVPVYSDKVDLKFIKYIVAEDRFTKYLEDCSSGSSNSQKRVTPDVIMDAQIMLPEKTEQIQIGTFLSNLDNLITLHQEKYHSYEKIKSALLQQMFI